MGASGPVLGVVAGLGLLGMLARGAAGVGTPIGRICEMAGLAAIAAAAANTIREVERRLGGPITNLFISNDNPASHRFHTLPAGGSPDAPATQSLGF